MKIFKKIIGYFFLSIPFLFLFIVLTCAFGWKITLIGLGIIAIIVFFIIMGYWFLND
ncbi:MAG: hypothetical protein JXA68_00255 [Ignavibacteriales bacterium]|nr:hypothetical protein [Ignavibacteriales bacterium]